MPGGATLNELLSASRISRDVDLFHDTESALDATWQEDRKLLQQHGYEVLVVRERPSFVEAEVIRRGEAVLLQWVRDSAFRFFPLVQHAELGLTLHPFDLATNKVLALVGRLEVRDRVDTIECSERLQPLGFLAWAACGKDPGFSPLALIEHAARTAHYSAEEVGVLEAARSPATWPWGLSLWAALRLETRFAGVRWTPMSRRTLFARPHTVAVPPNAFSSYQTFPLAASDRAPASAAFNLAPRTIAVGSVSGTAIGGTTGRRSHYVALRFDDGTSMPLIDESATGEAFSYPVPSPPGASFVVAAADGDSLTPYAVVHRENVALNQADIALTIPTPVTLSSPQTDGVVTASTPFSWSPLGQTARVFLWHLEVPGPSGACSYSPRARRSSCRNSQTALRFPQRRQ